MISAKVIAHSKSVAGKEIITLQLRYPKFIHSEFMTHRVFSRNASSSRAIPFERFVADIEKDMAMPVHWGKNQPGMQAHEEVDEEVKQGAIFDWKLAFIHAKNQAECMAKRGIHKQIVNRLLEPFYYINVLVTATEWDNFFELRDHPDAQPEIRALAVEIKKAISASTPKLLEKGQWHLPYVTQGEKDQLDLLTQIKASVARCARVSYLTHENKIPALENDLKLYERLVGSKPPHYSPLEHQATPDFKAYFGSGDWNWPQLHGNFCGWIQHRKLHEKSMTPLDIWR